MDLYSPGVLAFSRILNDEEVVTAANAATDPATTVAVDVTVDAQLTSDRRSTGVKTEICAQLRKEDST